MSTKNEVLALNVFVTLLLIVSMMLSPFNWMQVLTIVSIIAQWSMILVQWRVLNSPLMKESLKRSSPWTMGLWVIYHIGMNYMPYSWIGWLCTANVVLGIISVSTIVFFITKPEWKGVIEEVHNGWPKE